MHELGHEFDLFCKGNVDWDLETLVNYSFLANQNILKKKSLTYLCTTKN
jgi:hypothetical protein